MPAGNEKHESGVAVRLAANVRRLREAAGYSIDGLAERAGVSAITVRSVEKQKRWPSPNTLEALAKVLAVSPADLIS
jgi:transcriptional regulator with XRE-family HTH domain